MDFSGERFLPQVNSSYISYEHWHRYFLASEFVQSKVVLDIASGEGYGSYVLAEKAAKVIGVDISAEAVHYASSKYPKENLKFFQGSVASIPVEGEAIFDVIVSFETIEHVPFDDQQKFLREVKRLLKPGGIFIVSTPNKLLYSDIPQYQNEYHVKEYYVDEFIQFLGSYFENSALLGQKVYPVSYIWPFDRNTHKLIEHRIRLMSTGFNQTNEAKEAVYVIAVCSNAELPEIGPFLQIDLSQQMVMERVQEIQSLQAQLAAVESNKVQEIQSLQAQLAAVESNKVQEIQSLQTQLAAVESNKVQEVQLLRAKLAAADALQKEKELADLTISARLSDRERTVNTLSGRLAQEEQTVRGLREQLYNTQQAYEEASRTLVLIFGSTAWKVIRVLWAVRLFLAPHGSRREAFARWLSDIAHGHRKLFVRRKEAQAAPAEPAPAAEMVGPLPAEGDVSAVSTDPVYVDSYENMLAAAVNTGGDDYVPLSQHQYPAEQLPIKAIAFYLPQFHPIPENDEWWGKGFTEWRNVSKAVPQFLGHYQPHLPGELGYYDLRVPEVQQRQVELARQYGISGFCFYYYWFNGKRLLERPLEQFMNNPAIDFPFCLCWANENWTRTWDGQEREILMEQVHSEESDFAFIRDTLPIMKHKNYIKIDGRPVLIVYRTSIMPDPKATAQRWKSYCRLAGLPEPYLISAQTFGRIDDPYIIDFDAAVEFPPHVVELENMKDSLQLLNPNYQGIVCDYREYIEHWANEFNSHVFHTVFPSWDNEPRKPGRGSTFAFSSPAYYQKWLKKACIQTLKKHNPDERIVFINAWNEWAEGAHLEPDQKYGYAYLQATADTLVSFKRDRSISENAWTILFVSHDANKGGAQSVLLNILTWLKQHTAIQLKVLCLGGGEWLGRFQDLADTLVLPEQEGPNDAWNEKVIAQVLILCGGKPDLIYGNSVASGKIYKLISSLNVPIVTHFHELEMSIQKYGGAWIKDVLKVTQKYIACSNAVCDNLLNRYNIDPASIETIYECIQTDAKFDPRSDKMSIRQKLGLKTDAHLVFGCGLGMHYRKGGDLFIEVARALRRKGHDNFHFYWVGEFEENLYDPTGKIWGDYQRELRGDPLREYVTFLGIKENPREYLRAGDTFLLPSREDPFPLVALEAADCGLPVICFEGAGGMPDFVEADAGFVVPLENIDEMANRVVMLMQNEELRKQKGNVARKKLHALYSMDSTVPRILSLCREIAGKHPTISVIVPNYNHASYLPRRLESIFTQTFRDFEVILLDDASTDDSVTVLDRYTNCADVRLVKNERNTGSPFDQWLKGMELANADILWIAESDDASEPGFLDVLLPSFNNPQVSLAYANSFIIDENDVVIGDYPSTEYLTSLSPTKWTSDYQASAEQEINDGLGVKNTILNISSALFRKPVLDEKMQSQLQNMHIMGDWYFLAYRIKSKELCYKAEKLNYHRRHSASVIGQTVSDKKVERFFAEFCIVQRYIFENYRLDADFARKWEEYLRKQWNDFYPGRNFEELLAFFPFGEIKNIISINCGNP